MFIRAIRLREPELIAQKGELIWRLIPVGLVDMNRFIPKVREDAVLKNICSEGAPRIWTLSGMEGSSITFNYDLSVIELHGPVGDDASKDFAELYRKGGRA
jgi:hypothetical protein